MLRLFAATAGWFSLKIAAIVELKILPICLSAHHAEQKFLLTSKIMLK